MRTSKLICMIFYNEGTIEVSKISFYIKKLIEYGYLQKKGMKVKLTDKGIDYSGFNIKNKDVV